jgi:hypothetical protein
MAMAWLLMAWRRLSINEYGGLGFRLAMAAWAWLLMAMAWRRLAMAALAWRRLAIG